MDFVSLALWDRDFLDDDDLVAQLPPLLFSDVSKRPALHAPHWVNMYGAPTRDVADAPMARDMNVGKSARVETITPSTWRGRLLFALRELPATAPEAAAAWLSEAERAKLAAKRAAKNGGRAPAPPAPRKRPRAQRLYKKSVAALQPAARGGLLPAEAPFALRVALYGVVGLARAGGGGAKLRDGKKLGVEVTVGAWRLPGADGRKYDAFGEPATLGSGMKLSPLPSLSGTTRSGPRRSATAA